MYERIQTYTTTIVIAYRAEQVNLEKLKMVCHHRKIKAKENKRRNSRQ